MLHRLPIAALLAGAVAWGAGAAAEPPPKPPAAPEVHRDPRGVKGISPFREALKRAEGVLLARDLPGAVLAYRDAISKEPENALGHYRLGEAQVMKGDLTEAEASFNTGLRFVTVANPSLKAKLLFALADLRERQHELDQAAGQWTAYEAFATTQSNSHGFAASATERRKAIETWKQVESDSLVVKARIEKGMQAADEAVKKSSK